MLQSKRISNNQKTEILRKVLTSLCDTIAIEFLGIIANEKSVQIVRQVIKAYDTLYKEKAGIVSIKAHVAQKMEAAEIEALQRNLQKVIHKKADLKIEVDNNLLGGIKLGIENTFLDASLKSKLNRLKGELLQS